MLKKLFFMQSEQCDLYLYLSQSLVTTKSNHCLKSLHVNYTFKTNSAFENCITKHNLECLSQKNQNENEL